MESKQWIEGKVQVEADLRDALAARILEALAGMRRDLPPLEPDRGWQSGQALHERDDLRELVACVHRGNDANSSLHTNRE